MFRKSRSFFLSYFFPPHQKKKNNNKWTRTMYRPRRRNHRDISLSHGVSRLMIYYRRLDGCLHTQFFEFVFIIISIFFFSSCLYIDTTPSKNNLHNLHRLIDMRLSIWIYTDVYIKLYKYWWNICIIVHYYYKEIKVLLLYLMTFRNKIFIYWQILKLQKLFGKTETLTCPKIILIWIIIVSRIKL